MKKPYKVVFEDKVEIRMGSPFNHCTVRFEGFELPEIKEGGFQDLLSWDVDFKHLALIKWNINDKNEPGFNIYVANADNEKIIFCSERIEGVCKQIEFVKKNIIYTAIKNGNERDGIVKFFK